MELLEYQAKELLQRFRIPCTPHFLIEERTLERFREGSGGVLRPQIRGEILEGGELKASNGKEVVSIAQRYLGKRIGTQGGSHDGFVVDKILFLPAISKEKELFLRVGINQPGVIKVEVREGEKILSEIVQDRRKLFRFQNTRLVSPLTLSPVQKAIFARTIDEIVAALFYFDATFIEINPFVVTEEKTLLAYKIKMGVDERAFFRQKELQAFYENRQMTFREKVTHSPFPYVMGVGNIGCLANGRGLADYTATSVRKEGGFVAGILDVGHTCQQDTLHLGLEVLFHDPSVHIICMNLFTGVVNGESIVSALLKKLSSDGSSKIHKQVFLRMEGTNAQRGILLAASSLTLHVTSVLEQTVKNAVAAAKAS